MTDTYSIPFTSYKILDLFIKSWQKEFNLNIPSEKEFYFENIYKGYIIDYRIFNEILVWTIYDKSNFPLLLEYNRIKEIIPYKTELKLDIDSNPNDFNNFLTMQILKMLYLWGIIYYDSFEQNLGFLNTYNIDKLYLFKGMSIGTKKWLNFAKHYKWVDDTTDTLDITKIQATINTQIDLIAFSSTTLFADVTDDFLHEGSSTKNILFIFEIPKSQFASFTHIYYGGSFTYTPETNRETIERDTNYEIDFILDDPFKEFEFLINIGAKLEISEVVEKPTYIQIKLKFLGYNSEIINSFIDIKNHNSFLTNLIDTVVNKSVISDLLKKELSPNEKDKLLKLIDIKNKIIIEEDTPSIQSSGIEQIYTFGGIKKKKDIKKAGLGTIIGTRNPLQDYASINPYQKQHTSMINTPINTKQIINIVNSQIKTINNSKFLSKQDKIINVKDYLKEYFKNKPLRSSKSKINDLNSVVYNLSEQILLKNKELNLNKISDINELSFYIYIFKNIITQNNYNRYFGTTGGSIKSKKLLKKY